LIWGSFKKRRKSQNLAGVKEKKKTAHRKKIKLKKTLKRGGGGEETTKICWGRANKLGGVLEMRRGKRTNQHRVYVRRGGLGAERD